jgi:uroporphyrinogen-III decarboxylase
MGMETFARHFHKKTPLYHELKQFYFEITRSNLQGTLDAIKAYGPDCRIKVINFLDDVAFKGRPMISPARWVQDFLPLYKELTRMIHDAGCYAQIHTDGDVTELVPAFQAAGFDALQGWEGGCDPVFINDHFPDFIVVGFGDVSQVLPFGTQEHVRTHVRELIEIFKENRHFILGPSTVVFKGMPFENVVMFLQAAHQFGRYE